MIDPSYLATLRSSQLRPELLMTMVQLDTMLGWWEGHEQMATELGLTRNTFSYHLKALSRKGLVAQKTFLNGAGTFVWWVKRSPTDTPDPSLVPAYVVRNIERREHVRIPVDGITEWAKRRGIPRTSMWAFLSGGRRVLRSRWELVSSPYDVEEVAA